MIKVLLIDDSVSARYFIKDCISDDGEYEIYEAVDGKDGVEKYKDIVPHITFLDLTMPVMNGFEALREIRAYDGNALVVALTSDIQKRTVQKIMELGAFDFLSKPPQKEALKKTLKKARAVLADAG